MLNTIKLIEKIKYLVKTDCDIQILSELGGISITIRGNRKPVYLRKLFTKEDLLKHNNSQEYNDFLIEDFCRRFNHDYEYYIGNQELVKIQ